MMMVVVILVRSVIRRAIVAGLDGGGSNCSGVCVDTSGLGAAAAAVGGGVEEMRLLLVGLLCRGGRDGGRLRRLHPSISVL